ncbi:sensor histidine kinase KdpD [Lutibacter sp. B1]|uniref:sensor histidine kinase n=1 Tax=Lutibacter sp. B1 TaxID=2725996 RepID=UPI00145766F8|nr:HAMP domain-containing sensor histidine kinase [Lutibacter sp. B1]NLP57325.1 HAMP domain-containing histidine kinase [Lutibacter sp. B1]
MNKKASVTYVNELEEKIVDLSLKLNKAKNELTSVYQGNTKLMSKLAHNLKNPIGLIFSFSDIILEDVQNGSTEKLEQHVKIIKNSAGYSLELLNSVAKLVQLQSVQTLNFSEKNYIDVLNNVISNLTELANAKNIKIVKNFSKEDLYIKINEAEISKAIENIINNAIRFSNQNTAITITVSENENMVETIIEDEGIGISEENIPNILNEFYVENTYSPDKQKCIGLGLAIANRVIQQHKGKISIKSIKGEGSSFIITLPKN